MNIILPDLDEKTQFLSLIRLPAILNDEQAGWVLGFTSEDMGRLVSLGYLKALGGAGVADRKRFSAQVILGLRQDLKWLARATDTLYRRPPAPTKAEASRE
jgi:hypothetical protein